MNIFEWFQDKEKNENFNLIVCDPPFGIGKALWDNLWEKKNWELLFNYFFKFTNDAIFLLWFSPLLLPDLPWELIKEKTTLKENPFYFYQSSWFNIT